METRGTDEQPRSHATARWLWVYSLVIGMGYSSEHPSVTPTTPDRLHPLPQGFLVSADANHTYSSILG